MKPYGARHRPFWAVTCKYEREPKSWRRKVWKHRARRLAKVEAENSRQQVDQYGLFVERHEWLS